MKRQQPEQERTEYVPEVHPRLQLAYADDPNVQLGVKLLVRFTRGEMRRRTEADSWRNVVIDFFDKMPEASEVLAVRSWGPMFLLIKERDAWFDAAGRPVALREEEE